jgi:tetratricopeptide (TPR) repeat protein
MVEIIHLPQVKVDCLRNLGSACWLLGEFEQSKANWEGSLAICREIGDLLGEGKALNNLGLIHRDRGEFIKAKKYYEQSLAITRETGDRLSECVAMNNLGFCLRCLGSYDKAQELLEQALGICGEIGARQAECMVLTNLGMLAHYRGNNEAARNYAQRAIRLSKMLGARRDLTDALLCLGHAWAGLGRYADAAEVYQLAMDVRGAIGQTYLAMDIHAGLAHAALMQEDYPNAQTHIEEILAYLEAHSLDGNDDPMRIFHVCYRVLVALQDSRAKSILEMAYRHLMSRAQQIEEPDIRKTFLETNLAHRYILTEWEMLLAD